MFKNHIISLIGMSGVGKTSLLKRFFGDKVFHYSVDYVIAYILKDEICTTLKLSDVDFVNKVKVHDLSVLSDFISKIGNGSSDLKKDEFVKRQNLYRNAEKQATLRLQSIVQDIFKCGYNCIINDLTGSICEIIDVNDIENDAVMSSLRDTKIIYIQADNSHIEKIKTAFQNHPKPLLYNHEFFIEQYDIFCKKNNFIINANDFCNFIFPNLLNWRIPRYEKIAQYGKSININDYRANDFVVYKFILEN